MRNDEILLGRGTFSIFCLPKNALRKGSILQFVLHFLVYYIIIFIGKARTLVRFALAKG